MYSAAVPLRLCLHGNGACQDPQGVGKGGRGGAGGGGGGEYDKSPVDFTMDRQAIATAHAPSGTNRGCARVLLCNSTAELVQLVDYSQCE